MQFIFNNGDQNISRDGAPDLRLHGALAVTQKMFDVQMLLDPFEEQFNLPTTFVQSRNGRCWQRGIVRQVHQSLWFSDGYVPNVIRYRQAALTASEWSAGMHFLHKLCRSESSPNYRFIFSFN